MIWLLAGVLLIPALVRIVREFRTHEYDWDVDHEVYFGQELLRGNPIWVSEFHDKLPVLQYLFAIAALFDDPIFAWRLISLGSAILASFAIFWLLPQVVDTKTMSRRSAQHLSVLSISMFFFVSSAVPGGLTHFNVLSASTAITAFLLVARSERLTTKPALWFLFAVLASIFATLSISVRPYFLFPLAVGFWWGAWRVYRSANFSAATKARRIAALFLAPLSWVLQQISRRI